MTTEKEVENIENTDVSAPEDYDPHLYRKIKHPSTNFETFVNLLKSSLGTGILAIPQAFSYAGILVGCIGTILIGTVLTHSLHVLIRSEHAACKRKRVPQLTYRMSMTYLVHQGPPMFRCLAYPMGITVDVFLVVYQLGACCVYIVFMANNLKKIFDPIQALSIETYILIILLPLLFFNLIPSLKVLAPLTAFANLITLTGIAIIVYYLLASRMSTSSVELTGSLSHFPLYAGTVLFSLVSVGVVVTAEASMKTPESFRKPLGVLNLSMGCVLILYTFIGAIGYNYCVSQCSDTITLDLPSGVLPIIVKVLFVLAIFISYSLQCYVPVEILWRGYLKPRLVARGVQHTRVRLCLFALRITLCVFTFVVTLAVPKLGLFISLFGALCLSALGICFPAFMEICNFYPDKYGPMRIYLVKNIFLFLLGLTGLVSGTWTSLVTMIRTF